VLTSEQQRLVERSRICPLSWLLRRAHEPYHSSSGRAGGNDLRVEMGVDELERLRLMQS